MEQTKYLLDEKAIPESWYNLVPDLPFPLEPPLNPTTMEPAGPEAFAPIFPQAIIEQEVTAEPHVPKDAPSKRSLLTGIYPCLVIRCPKSSGTPNGCCRFPM